MTVVGCTQHTGLGTGLLLGGLSALFHLAIGWLTSHLAVKL